MELSINGKNRILKLIDLTSGMVLSEDVFAKDDLPPYRASIMVSISIFICD